MSKIECTCGSLILDNTDYLSNKAHFIADQDFFDFLDEMENFKGKDAFRVASNYFQQLFQCTHCKNLIIIRENERFDFKPLQVDKGEKVLQSFKKEKWLGVISANYMNGQGEIFWRTNTESGYKRELPLEELKSIYFSKLDELKRLHVLRHAFLRIDGEIEHDFELKK